MARHRRVFSVLVAAAWQLLSSQRARAYEEQASFDMSAGYVSVVDSAHLPAQGTALDLGAALGISDIAVLRGLLGYALLPEGRATAHVGRLRVEALYLVDVLQFVPFFGLGAGLFVARQGDSGVDFLPAGQLVFGADYLLSRSWTLGLDVRTGALLERGEVRSTSDVSLRLSRMFETF